MSLQVETLWEMQCLDKEKKVLMTQLQEFDTTSLRNLRYEIKLLEERINAKKEELFCLQKVCERKEINLNRMTEKCKGIEMRLYSGQIKNMKELEELQEKYTILQNDTRIYEEDLLESMGCCEEIMQEIKSEETLIYKKKKEHAKLQEAVNQSIHQLEERTSCIQMQHSALLEKLDQDLLEIYLNLAKKINMPVAKVKDGICTGCHRSIPMRQLQIDEHILHFCDNCGRLILIV